MSEPTNYLEWKAAVDSAPLIDPNPKTFKGYLPIQMSRRTGDISVAWMQLGPQHRHYPFYHEKAYYAWKDAGCTGIVMTRLEYLRNKKQLARHIYPDGFIFHVSRCGSTLLANMLATMSANWVVVEPDPLNGILSLPEIPWDMFELMVGALGVPSHRLYIKFSSWNSQFLGKISSMFPRVPWIFLYRDPVEVLAAQLEGARFFDDSSLEKRAAVLGCFMDTACRLGANRQLLLNYSEIDSDFPIRLARFFMLEPTKTELQAMKNCLAYYSKSLTAPVKYSSDISAKQGLADSHLRSIVARFAKPAYARIEAIRIKAIPETASPT